MGRMSERLSQGQLDVLEMFNSKPMINKSVPHYWDPKPLMNDQIDRLAARGFIKCEDLSQPELAQFFKLTEKGAARIGMELCKSCESATHPQEAACLHCGSTKTWATTPSTN
jgi:hypothetical protein